MRTCHPRVRRTLVQPRLKGLSGPMFQPSAGGCVKDMGNALGIGGPLAGPKAYQGLIIDATTVEIYFTQCVSVPGPGYAGIQYSINGGAWVNVTGELKVNDTQWQFTTGTITAGDEVRWRYVGGSDTITDCEAPPEDIGDQGPIVLENPLVLEGNFILLETGGADIILLEDDTDGTNGLQLEDAP